MKAQARKILALIMAMVMSLSLAAPAFAEAEEADASAPAPEAVEVVETEAPEKEEEEEKAPEAQETKEEKKSDKKLKAQAAVNNVAFDSGSTNKLNYDDETGTYTITDNTGAVLASGDLTAATQPSGVTVTLTKSPDWIIDYAAKATYTVKYDNATATAEVGTASSTRKSFNDAEWRELDGSEAVIVVDDNTDPDTFGKVKGYVYEEKKPNGAVNAYFKLMQGTPTGAAPTSYSTTELKFVAKSVAPLKGDSDVQSALLKAIECNEFGETGTNAVATHGVIKLSAFVKVDSEQTAPEAYQFAVMNQSDCEVNTTASTGAAIDTCKVNTGKTTGTFQVSIYNKSFIKAADYYYVTNEAEAKELLQKQFANIKTVTLESVTGPTGNYWTVTVKKVEDSTAAGNGYSKNVMKRDTGKTDKSGNKIYAAVLINDAKGGFYNGKDDKGTDGENISAGKVATGKVVVRKADISSVILNTTDTFTNLNKKVTDKAAVAYNKSGTAVTGTLDKDNFDFVVFNSLDDAKGVFAVTDCKQNTTVPYAAMKLNALVGGVKNPYVTVTEYSQTYTASSGFASETNATVTTQDGLIAAGEAAVYNTPSATDGTTAVSRKRYKATEASTTWFLTAYNTDKAAFVEKGSLEVKAANHGDLKEVVEETAATCKAKGSKTTKKVCSKCGTVISQKTEETPAISDPVEKNNATDPTDSTKKKIVFDDADVKDGKPQTKHYVAKAEKVTTLSDDKMTTTVTTTYTCNFGFVHDELTTTESTTKTELQHAGRWNHISLDKKTALDTSDGFWSLLKSVKIADSDIDNANVPMNRTAEYTKDGNPDTIIYAPLGSGVTGWTYANGVYSSVFTPATVTVNTTTGVTTVTPAPNGVGIYASSTGVPTSKYYAAVVTVSDVKLPQYKHQDTTNTRFCDDGSCVVGVTVYEVKGEANNKADGFNNAANYDSAVTGSNLTNNLKNGKVVVVNDSFKETVTLTGSGHKYFNDDGVATELCTHCGTKRENEAPVSNVIDPANVTVKNLTYTGKVAQPKVKVKDADGFTLILGTDYVVSEVDEVNVGEYSITIKGINEYAGNKFTKTFKITQAKQPMKLSATTVNAKVKDVKKKAKTYALKVTKAQGKVTVKSNKSNVTWKSNKVTVKKGTKKMTVKLTFKAAGNANYKSGSKTAKVVIK